MEICLASDNEFVLQVRANLVQYFTTKFLLGMRVVFDQALQFVSQFLVSDLACLIIILFSKPAASVSGLCRLTLQPASSGLWTVYHMKHKDSGGNRCTCTLLKYSKVFYQST